MKSFISTTFSINMLKNTLRTGGLATVDVEEVLPRDIPKEDLESAVAYEDAARVLSTMFNTEIKVNKSSVQLDDDSDLYVANFIGGRIPDGADVLPGNMDVRFYRVSLVRYNDEDNG